MFVVGSIVSELVMFMLILFVCSMLNMLCFMRWFGQVGQLGVGWMFVYFLVISVLLLSVLLFVQFYSLCCMCVCIVLVNVLVKWLVSVFSMIVLQLLWLVLNCFFFVLMLRLVVIVNILMQLVIFDFFGVMKLVSEWFGCIMLLIIGCMFCWCRLCYVSSILECDLLLQILMLLLLMVFVGSSVIMLFVVSQWFWIRCVSIDLVLENMCCVDLLMILLFRIVGYGFVRFQVWKNGFQLMQFVSLFRLQFLNMWWLMNFGLIGWQLVQLILVLFVCVLVSVIIGCCLWFVCWLWMCLQLDFSLLRYFVVFLLDSRFDVIDIECDVFGMQMIGFLQCGVIFIVVCMCDVVVLLISSGIFFMWKQLLCCILDVMYVIFLRFGVMRFDSLMMFVFLIFVFVRILLYGIIMFMLIILKLLYWSMIDMMFLLMLCMLFFMVVMMILFFVCMLLFVFVSSCFFFLMNGIRCVIVCFIMCVDFMICGRNILFWLNRLLMMFILFISGFLIMLIGWLLVVVIFVCIFLVFLMMKVVMLCISVCESCFLIGWLCYLRFFFFFVLFILNLLVILSR